MAGKRNKPELLRGSCAGNQDSCPSVFITGDRERYLIVGRIPDKKSVSREVRKKIGKGETVVEVYVGLLDGLSKS